MANREIKFRAWDGTEGKMLRHPVELKQLLRQISDRNDNSLGGDAIRRHELDWMQYTGLKDRNGVEIYDDDIVRFNGFRENGDDFIAVIEFKFNSFVGWFLHKDFEVIGNIYENPELLKEQTNGE